MTQILPPQMLFSRESAISKRSSVVVFSKSFLVLHRLSHVLSEKYKRSPVWAFDLGVMSVEELETVPIMKSSRLSVLSAKALKKSGTPL